MKIIVVLSGAGISAESGLSTFRDHDGLWNGYKVEDVATPQAFVRNPGLVLDFYNQRRRQLLTVEPNNGHKAIARLEEKFKVYVVTQNVDDLHERAGSTKVIHLHGRLLSARSSVDPDYLVVQANDIEVGDLCPEGGQMRPDIVWFGEAVPLMDEAVSLVKIADYLFIVGTSMQVYPAAGLVDYAPQNAEIFYFDKNPASVDGSVKVIAGPSGETLPKLVDSLLI